MFFRSVSLPCNSMTCLWLEDRLVQPNHIVVLRYHRPLCDNIRWNHREMYSGERFSLQQYDQGSCTWMPPLQTAMKCNSTRPDCEENHLRSTNYSLSFNLLIFRKTNKCFWNHLENCWLIAGLTNPPLGRFQFDNPDSNTKATSSSYLCYFRVWFPYVSPLLFSGRVKEPLSTLNRKEVGRE